MNINQYEKKYVDARASHLYITSFTKLEHLHNQESFGTCEYDDILAALTVNQLLFENSSGFWEITQPEKIIQVELDNHVLFIFHTTLPEVEVSADGKIHRLDLRDSPGMIIVSDEAIQGGDGISLPSTHGFIKIVNSNNNTHILNLGEISIELEHN